MSTASFLHSSFLFGDQGCERLTNESSCKLTMICYHTVDFIGQICGTVADHGKAQNTRAYRV